MAELEVSETAMNVKWIKLKLESYVSREMIFANVSNRKSKSQPRFILFEVVSRILKATGD